MIAKWFTQTFKCNHQYEFICQIWDKKLFQRTKWELKNLMRCKKCKKEILVKLPIP